MRISVVVELLWICCKPSKFVQLYIYCVFHLVDNHCCNVGTLHNKSTTNGTNGIRALDGLVRFVVQLVVHLL